MAGRNISIDVKVADLGDFNGINLVVANCESISV